jgi:hypothetical protein
MSWSARLANSERSIPGDLRNARQIERMCSSPSQPIRCPQCGAPACKLPAPRPLPYTSVRILTCKILTCKGIRTAANTSEHSRAVTNGGQNHSRTKRIGGKTKTH